MKKFFLLVALLVSVSLSSKAATVTVGVASAAAQNVAFALGTNTSAVITAVTLVSTNNQTATIAFYDSYWSTLKVTNSAYHTITSYATNSYTSWTNYYGATNYSGTNIMLVDITNTVAAVTNSLTPVFIANAGTNGSTTYAPLNLKIVNGLWLTNTTASSLGTVTITYNQ